MVFTLIGFKTVPVGVFIVACVAKQRGSWKERTWHILVVSSNALLGRKCQKPCPLLENTRWQVCYKQVFMTSEIKISFWLMKLQKQTNRTNQVFFLYLRFLVIKPENTFFFNLSSTLRWPFFLPKVHIGLVDSQPAKKELAPCPAGSGITLASRGWTGTVLR